MAAAALAAGGLVTALTSMTPPLPDVQIRDFDLAATRNVDTTQLLETVENHVRPDLSGAGEGDGQQISLGELLLGPGSGDLGIGSTSEGNLVIDDEAVKALMGGGLDPQTLYDAGLTIAPIDLGPVVGVGAATAPTTAGALGGSEQAIGAAAASVLSGMALALPAAYQAMTSAVASIEADLNNALVNAQMEAAEKLFGDNPEVNDVVNWIFTVNNTLLAQNESAFNSLFGIPFDAHTSLLSHLDTGMADADWSVLLGLTPGEFDEIVNAIQADNFSLLGSIDWAGLFASLF
ncbi:hypothetical protein [[Mycobacterium] nativiensis]|uniref:Uncharacterized protein n=1 Tax=[Mycobacterium] nativiensis TaxID=2855503 RepID=A0ABU5XUB0_9MYCO|nr:hypothetical protein [Mycolicibacter sp. MYC340]MEB3031387.1 hypothetical protein [Mycolicibacter sp. MYC340]